MPIEMTVKSAERLVLGKLRGSIDTREMLVALDGVVADPEFRSGFDVLSDHREIDSPLTPEQLQALLGYLSTLGDSFAGSKWAIVTTAPASYGMMRMLSVLAEPIGLEVRVFREMDDAREWLRAGER